MKAQVNELLLYARLPFHFWTELNGGNWPFDNPGCSVLSLCAARLNQQLVDVPAEVEEALDQCREFTTSVATTTQIMQWVEQQASKLVAQANAQQVGANVFKELTGLMAGIQKLKSTLEMLFSGVTTPMFLDAEEELTVMFMQDLINSKVLIENLQGALAAPVTPAA